MGFKDIFINNEEKRLRAGWRITLFLLVYFASLLIISFIIGFFIGFIAEIFVDYHHGEFEYLNQILELSFTNFISAIAVISAIYFAGKYFDKRKMKDFGLMLNKVWFQDLLRGILTGILMISIIFAVEYLTGMIEIQDTFLTLRSDGNFYLEIIIPFVLFLLVGIHEEILCRGYILKNLGEGFNNITAAVVVSSLIFSLLHYANPNLTIHGLINIFLIGIFLAAVFVYSKKLAFPIGFHISWNFFVGNVFGFPVSGIEELSNISFLSVNYTEDYSFWTGGSFGPEGGMLATIVILLGLLFLKTYYDKGKYNNFISKKDLSNKE